MTPTTQPVEPSKEALKAACAIAEVKPMDNFSMARIIDSSFAELRRERDEMREFIEVHVRCSCGPSPKAPWCRRCSVLRKPTTPGAGRGK